MYLQLANMDSHQFSAGEFSFHADFGQQGYAISHNYETLVGLECWQFHVLMQGRLVTAEGLNHFVALGRRNHVRDERLCTQLANADLTNRG